jgi:hypothetical protein
LLQTFADPLPASGCRIVETGGQLDVVRSPDLASHVLKDGTGRILGDVYGHLLPAALGPGLAIRGRDIVVDAGIEGAEAFEDRVLRRLCGTFAVVTHTHLPRRFYPDAAATVPLVYCARSRRAGSSVSLFLDAQEYAARFLAERHGRLVARGPAADRWIPGSLTAHEGVSRLLPNHYLDLETWQAVRFWPRRGFALRGTRRTAAERVAGRLQATVCAAAGDWRHVGLAMTAGFDSRLLLAAARPVADRLHIFTLTPEERGIDQIMSREICDHLGLSHSLRPIESATESEAAAWDRAVGHALHHVNRTIHPSIRNLDCDMLLTGILGETGRCRLYRQEGAAINDTPVSPGFLLARMGMPHDPDLLADAEAWLGGLSGLPASVILDLAVLERFYMPIWRPAQCALIPEIMPFADSVVQETFLALPPEEKGTEALFNDCIRLLWPEALDLPINSFGDYRDMVAKVRKALKPRRVMGFVQKKLAETRS